MAVQTEQPRPVLAAGETVKAALSHGRRAAATIQTWAQPVGRRLAESAPARFLSRTLFRRIFLSGVLGLSILLIGILYLTHRSLWLIQVDAKRDSLRVQGEIIAAAIAANAAIENDTRIAIDADKLTGADDPSSAIRDEGISALKLSIHPEQVTPILRRLLEPTTVRARIYSRGGTLIVDSATLLPTRQFTPPVPTDAGSTERPKTKNFWTRMTARITRHELPVYREIGSSNGMAYPEVRMAMVGATTPMLLLTEQGEQIVSVAIPIRQVQDVPAQGVLLLSTRPGEIDDVLHEGRMVILWLALVAFLATGVTSVLLARTIAGPMRRLSEAAEHVSHNFGARQELPDLSNRRDEIGDMAASFRSMTTALYRRAEASEKFAADVAHELRNPLTAARSTAEALGYARTDEQRRMLGVQIQEELKRLNRLITDVSSASRLDAELAMQKNAMVDVREVLKGVVDTFTEMLSDDDRRVVLEVARPGVERAYTVYGHDGRLAQVMTNLIENAVSFSPSRGMVLVRAQSDGSEIRIVVEDEGPGIPEDKLEAVFERFYTDRPPTSGVRAKNSGLGLSISREIIRAHGGRILAENYGVRSGNGKGKPSGARFAVCLSCVRAASAQRS
ncbi:MAG: stimulus-sensing domain-containing protein [Hyphomicrobiaceae bacterium]